MNSIIVEVKLSCNSKESAIEVVRQLESVLRMSNANRSDLPLNHALGMAGTSLISTTVRNKLETEL